MKKTIFTILTLLLLPLLGGEQSSLSAQRRKTQAVTVSPEEYIEQYKFEDAISALESQISQLKRRRKPTNELEAQVERCEFMQRKLESTEQVIFIDSLVLPRESAFEALSLSSENGTISTYSAYFNQQDTLGCTVFKSQLGNKIIYAQPQQDGTAHLYESDLIGTSWTNGTRVSGLDDDDTQNYPFMLSDGSTLYYSAKNDECIGGYDIFMTRYDADEHRFLAPENIGMPFNSTANDYLYIIDDFHQLGWFVTDRNQEEGNVCIYCFIPNTSRVIYNEEELGAEKLASLARILSISDTWGNQEETRQGMDRLVALKTEADKRKSVVHDFDLVINDRLTYTCLSQFRSSQAKSKAQQWQKHTQELEKTTSELSSLRNKYSASTKASLSSQILSLEKKQEKLLSEIHSLEKEIRSLELNR